MARVSSNAKAKHNTKTKAPEKSKKPMTPVAARKKVLGCIGRPSKKAVSHFLAVLRTFSDNLRDQGAEKVLQGLLDSPRRT